MRRLPASAAAILSAGALAHGAHHPAATAGATPVVHLRPAVVRLGQHATISVIGIRARALEVRAVGATDIVGRPLPWRPLGLDHGTWAGTLLAPALRGVYPLELRTEPGGGSFRPRAVFLRVFARGTRARPPFDDPADVARWWVRSVPQTEVVALKAWPRPAFDRRDRRLHRLFVVAYSPPGHPGVDDRLGMFVTAFRDGYHARWRLLEATVAP